MATCNRRVRNVRNGSKAGIPLMATLGRKRMLQRSLALNSARRFLTAVRFATGVASRLERCNITHVCSSVVLGAIWPSEFLLSASPWRVDGARFSRSAQSAWPGRLWCGFRYCPRGKLQLLHPGRCPGSRGLTIEAQFCPADHPRRPMNVRFGPTENMRDACPATPCARKQSLL